MALAAARAVCDLPVVAMMAFDDDGATGLGFGAEEVVSALLSRPRKAETG